MSFFVWLGIALISPIFAYLLYEDWQFFSRPRQRTRGTVFGHHRTLDDGSAFFSSQIRFVDTDGKTIEFIDTYGRPVPKPRIGETIEVDYPIGRPQRARVARWWLRTMIYAVVVGMLSILVGMALGLLR
jgi:Protein of unknown function (DUF3592)